jgi:hypothetical protein
LALIGITTPSANGSFVSTSTSLSVSHRAELASDDSRRRAAPPKVRMAPLDDVASRAVTYMGFSAD